MGAGKTSVGHALSRRLGWSFVDLDAEIERHEKKTVREIFQTLGEAHFRGLEHERLEKLATRPNAVIALGGGAYIDPQNRELADSTGLTVWLKVSFATIRQRIKIDGTRPLFGDNIRAERLYEERLPAYSLARLHVSAEVNSPDRVAAEIVTQMERHRL